MQDTIDTHSQIHTQYTQTHIQIHTQIYRHTHRLAHCTDTCYTKHTLLFMWKKIVVLSDNDGTHIFSH